MSVALTLNDMRDFLCNVGLLNLLNRDLENML